MRERLRYLIRGFASNLKFSNRVWLTYNRLFRRNARAITYIWKNRLYIVCDCARGDHISVQEVLADRSYEEFISAALPVGSAINYVNVGANVGAFDLMLFDRGTQVASGLSVELNPRTFQRCLSNLQTNEISNVEVLNYGIADSDRFINFSPSNVSLGDNIFEASKSGDQDQVPQKVELISLETLLRKHGKAIENYDLLKLDCERAEYPILKSVSSELLRKFRNIVIEFHAEPYEGAMKEAYDRLAAAGYKSYRGRPGDPNFVDLFSRC